MQAQSLSYYEILHLPPPPHTTPTISEIRKAYHSALLEHHPDKSILTANDSSTPTVDEIVEAYNILSTSSLKVLYDQQLESVQQSKKIEEARFKRLIAQADSIDLDDFQTATSCVQHSKDIFAESSSITLSTGYARESCHGYPEDTCNLQQIWFRNCRCGKDDAYLVTESMLEHAFLESDNAQSDDRQILVQCSRCSTWIRVLFSLAE
ncbi:uncharacterized protein V1516DRAFT_682219 [Lipomyces oligophaga]|uniref:uncharacterized protein n=1 Tax=Lipomyces oligophaga TaxID=45792 RepID=UPI0034CF34AC